MSSLFLLNLFSGILFLFDVIVNELFSYSIVKLFIAST